MRKHGVDDDTYSRPQRNRQDCYGIHVIYTWAGVMVIGVLTDQGICAIKFHLNTDRFMSGRF